MSRLRRRSAPVINGTFEARRETQTPQGRLCFTHLLSGCSLVSHLPNLVFHISTSSFFPHSPFFPVCRVVDFFALPICFTICHTRRHKRGTLRLKRRGKDTSTRTVVWFLLLRYQTAKTKNFK